MFDKTAFLASIAHETKICKHLLTKLDESKLGYRPGEGMRSTTELLSYLTIAGIAPTQALTDNDWSRVTGHMERAKAVTMHTFTDAMDDQLTQIRAIVEPLTDDDLQRDAPFPWGGSTRLGVALVDLPLKFLAAYRLQLFCHAKATGRTEISTMNAWLGMDKPVEA